MPQASFTLDDQTPLTGPRIDVPARIGWLLRTTRLGTGLTLRQMSAALREHGVELSSASVSRIENEGRRSNEALDGYGRVAGLPEGRLRAGIDFFCRSFAYAPTRPPIEPMTLETVDEAHRRVDGPNPSASEWWRFACTQVQGTGFGVPSDVLAPYLERLTVETQRSVGVVRTVRWEAAIRLNEDRYDDAVARVLVPLALEADCQRPEDLLLVVAERPTLRNLALLTELLRHESLVLARSAAHALQSLLVRGGLSLQDWSSAVEPLRFAWQDHGHVPERQAVLGPLTAALPPPLHAQLKDVVRGPAVTAPPDLSRSSRNAHYAFAAKVSRAVTTSAQVREDPMLTRLLFEAFFEPRGVRMSNATLLLTLSRFRADIARVLPQHWDDGPDASNRAAVARVGAYCQDGEPLPDVTALLESADLTEFQHGLTYYAHSGGPLPQDALERGLAADAETVRRTMHCLGLAGDPRLDSLSMDADQPEAARGAARWWLARGPRLLD